ADTMATAPALATYAVGLPAFVAIKMLQPGFFARENTRTPMWLAAVAMLINVAAAFARSPVCGHGGLAAATSRSAWVNAGLLALLLWRNGGLVADASLRKRLPMLLVASLAMGAVLYAAYRGLWPSLATAGVLMQALFVGALVIGGMGVFLIFAQ